MRKKLHEIMTVDEMQCGFMPESGAIDAVFILRRLQEKYHANGKRLYMCFVDLKKASDIVPSSVGMGNEEERNTRSFGWISEEFV